MERLQIQSNRSQAFSDLLLYFGTFLARHDGQASSCWPHGGSSTWGTIKAVKRSKTRWWTENITSFRKHYVLQKTLCPSLKGSSGLFSSCRTGQNTKTQARGEEKQSNVLRSLAKLEEPVKFPQSAVSAFVAFPPLAWVKRCLFFPRSPLQFFFANKI